MTMFTGAIVRSKVDNSARSDFFSGVGEIESGIDKAHRALKEIRDREFRLLAENSLHEEISASKYSIAHRVIRLREAEVRFQELLVEAQRVAGEVALTQAAKPIQFKF